LPVEVLEKTTDAVDGEGTARIEVFPHIPQELVEQGFGFLASITSTLFEVTNHHPIVQNKVSVKTHRLRRSNRPCLDRADHSGLFL